MGAARRETSDHLMPKRRCPRARVAALARAILWEIGNSQTRNSGRQHRHLKGRECICELAVWIGETNLAASFYFSPRTPSYAAFRLSARR